jgi:TonB family protein
MIGSMGRADKPWLFAPLCLLLIALCGCSSLPRTPPLPHAAPLTRAPPPPPLSPFDDASVSIFVHGNFARGEQVVVRVCLRPDHSIASSDILESSGDRRFDALALDWARRVQLRSAPAPGHTVARCGPVRVELHDTAQPGMGHQPGEQLG